MKMELTDEKRKGYVVCALMILVSCLYLVYFGVQSLPYGACLGQNETISVSHRYGFCKRNSMINRLSDFYANSSAR